MVTLWFLLTLTTSGSAAPKELERCGRDALAAKLLAVIASSNSNVDALIRERGTAPDAVCWVGQLAADGGCPSSSVERVFIEVFWDPKLGSFRVDRAPIQDDGVRGHQQLGDLDAVNATCTKTGWRMWNTKSSIRNVIEVYEFTDGGVVAHEETGTR